MHDYYIKLSFVFTQKSIFIIYKLQVSRLRYVYIVGWNVLQHNTEDVNDKSELYSKTWATKPKLVAKKITVNRFKFPSLDLSAKFSRDVCNRLFK
jgi:hypothetical protein